MVTEVIQMDNSEDIGWEDEESNLINSERFLKGELTDEEVSFLLGNPKVVEVVNNIFDIRTKQMIDGVKKSLEMEAKKKCQKLLHGIENLEPITLIGLGLDANNQFFICGTTDTPEEVNFLLDQAKKRLLDVSKPV